MPPPNNTPTPLPKYIYKILPSSPPPPSPLPISLPISPLDAKDNFMHFSTSSQLLGTLSRFFSDASHVYILRVPFERVAEFVKWEDTKGNEAGLGEGGEGEGKWSTESEIGRGFFAHIYANGHVEEGGKRGLKLGREEVERVGEWKRGKSGWEAEGWPFGEDGPRA